MKKTIYVVAWTNYFPPMIDSVWSTEELATAHAKKTWTEELGEVLNVFREELDSSMFRLGKPVKTITRFD